MSAKALNDLLEKEDAQGDVDIQVDDEDDVDDFVPAVNQTPSSEGMCSECGDQMSTIQCEQCTYVFCLASIHHTHC